jgi:hypothetical protein
MSRNTNAAKERSNAAKQMIARKARIADIDRILVQATQMGPYGKPLVMSSQSRSRLMRERAELLYRNETEGQALALAGEKAGAQDGDGAAKLNASKTPAVDIRAAAPGVGLPLVDLRKPASTIAKETKRAALARGSPYRDVPNLGRILKAVEYKKTAGCTYRQASINEFGSPKWADKIRYWHNKRSHGEL